MKILQKKKYFWMPALVLALLLSACAKNHKNSSGASAADLVHRVPVRSEAHAQSLLDSVSIDCGNGQCHPAVGLALLRSEKEIDQCTAFLVDKNTVLTNSHCLSKEVVESAEACAAKLRFVFPGGKNISPKSVACQRVLGASKIGSAEDSAAIDIAAVAIEPLANRDALALDSNGISPEESFRILKIDPLSGGEIGGRYFEKDCVAKAETLHNSFFSGKESANINFSDCDVVKGNSGAPMVRKEKYAAFGLVQGTTNFESLETLRTKYQKFLAPTSLLKPMNLGTSLFCVTLSPGFSLREGCLAPIAKQEMHSSMQALLLMERVQKSMQKSREQVLQLESKEAFEKVSLKYEIFGADQERKLILEKPKLSCLRAPLAELTTQVPVLSFRQGLNEYLQPDLVVEKYSSIELKLSTVLLEAEKTLKIELEGFPAETWPIVKCE